MEVKIRTLFCCIFSCSILLLYIISINNIGIDAASASRSEPTDSKGSWSVNNAPVGSNFMSDKPYFEETNSKNVTAIAEDVAILKCRVKNKKNRTVSWMRKRDLHILTTNIYTYTGDQRFSVMHPPGSDDYDLRIEYTQPKDTGIYECQVNTEPKMNLAIHLQITDIEDDLDPSQNLAIPIFPKENTRQVSGGRKFTDTELEQRSNSVNGEDNENDVENVNENDIEIENENVNLNENENSIVEIVDDNNFKKHNKNKFEIVHSYQPFDYHDEKDTDTYFKLLNRDEHPAGLTTNKGTTRISNFIFSFLLPILGLLHWPSIS